MKNKINVIQTISVCYMLAMLFVILITVIFDNGIVIVDDLSKLGIYFFVIRPLPFTIAFYLMIGIKQLKHDSNKAYALQHEELSNKDKQIARQAILDTSRIAIIDIRDKEITELKGELASVANKEVKPIIKKKQNNPFRPAKTGSGDFSNLNDIPFSDKVPYIGQRVRVLYADKFIVGAITTVLNERVIKYRVKGAGSRKYKIEQMELIG